MGWLSKIFKGSSHKVSEGQYDWNDRYSEEETVGNEPSTSGDAGSETEDIDHAIALSLLEVDHERKNVVDYESQLQEDEQLAKALQESLNIEPPPQYGPGNGNGHGHGHGRGNANGNGNGRGNANGNGNGNVSGSGSWNGNGNIYQPMSYPYSTGFRSHAPVVIWTMTYCQCNQAMSSLLFLCDRVCAGCNTEIGYGRFLNCMNAVWHPECFRCHACNQPICDYEFSLSGNYPYHKFCYKEQYHPKCDVCKHFIPTNAAGLIEYRAHPFWVQKYCPFHEHDGTPRCCSCERMEPRETKYVALEDGRKLCLECLDSAIMDTNQCQPLYLDIQEFYERLNMKVEQEVPLLLVERQALNEAMDGEKSVRQIHSQMTNDSLLDFLFLLGELIFCSAKKLTVVLSRGQGHHHMPETRGLCLSEEQTVSTVADWFYPSPRDDARMASTSSLYLHIMSTSGSNGASTSSSASVSRSSKQGTRSPFERKLGDFFKHQIESDASPVYGNGFRAGNHAVLKYGLPMTLNHIRLTGGFPY
ncbi:hypothetical protein RHSIM_Rhsim06G0037300 [Rhododendron simsii]|uniref:LIM zinc-binding domain-containing protein n=1 Tax=Rhododendron simsii TaxID=118357 RepID=A0A834GQS1_RHOSS|nr:hypothetical protein RHSIM_Rhsim06G0037300 [Rhododendron simsii]